MSNGRHSFIAFYPSDWRAGTAHMGWTMKAVYHEICCYNWDKAEPMPAARLRVMLMSLPEGGEIVDALVGDGTLIRDSNGSIHSPRALGEAQKAFELWEKKSSGGRAKRGGGKTHGRELEESCQDSSTEPEPSFSVGKPTDTAQAVVDPIKELFDLGIAVLTATGLDEKRARSLIGKWRKNEKSDGAVLAGLIDAKQKNISDPVPWLEARFAGASKWVSASGYEYRGTDEQVMREAERRHDMATYWSVKSAIEAKKK